jgi:hypothetical protein
VIMSVYWLRVLHCNIHLDTFVLTAAKILNQASKNKVKWVSGISLNCSVRLIIGNASALPRPAGDFNFFLYVAHNSEASN